MQVVPIVLCGGSGTRLWPLSRRDHAKQHIPLLGGDSPFQRTLQRLAAVPGLGKPIVVAGQAGRFLAAEQARVIDVDVELVIEPVGRDTLPAVTLGALMAASARSAMPSPSCCPPITTFPTSRPSPPRWRARSRRPRRRPCGFRADADRPGHWLRLHQAGRAGLRSRPGGSRPSWRNPIRNAPRRSLPKAASGMRGCSPFERRPAWPRSGGWPRTPWPSMSRAIQEATIGPRGAAAGRELRDGAEGELRRRGNGEDRSRCRRSR